MSCALTAALCVACWCVGAGVLHWRARHWGAFASVFAAQADVTPVFVARCFAALAERLDAQPGRLRVRVHAPKGAVLDFVSEGVPVVRFASGEEARFPLRERWIADHPLPLALDGAELFFASVSGNRFRVATRPWTTSGGAWRPWLALGASLFATWAIVTCHAETIACLAAFAGPFALAHLDWNDLKAKGRRIWNAR